MKKRLGLGLVALLFIFVLMSCTGERAVENNPENQSEQNEHPNNDDHERSDEDSIDSNDKKGGDDSNNDGHPSEDEASEVTIEDRAIATIEALKNKELQLLSEIADPHQGVLFSPYAYVDIATAQVFTADQLKDMMNDDNVYTWGHRDGSGEAIELTFASYYDEFVYDVDFANAEQVSYNERIGQSNTIDNISEVYPNATVVEFHFSGFEEQYEGLDWKSLRLVFEPYDNGWYLVAIIHDQWTI